MIDFRTIYISCMVAAVEILVNDLKLSVQIPIRNVSKIVVRIE